jgi:predicted HicB family RNase H-like nuclease
MPYWTLRDTMNKYKKFETIPHKEFEGIYWWDDSSSEFFGECKQPLPNSHNHIVTFVGSTHEEIQKSFEESVDCYLEAYKKL